MMDYILKLYEYWEGLLEKQLLWYTFVDLVVIIATAFAIFYFIKGLVIPSIKFAGHGCVLIYRSTSRGIEKIRVRRLAKKNRIAKTTAHKGDRKGHKSENKSVDLKIKSGGR